MTRLDNGVGVYTGFLPNSSGARDIPGELFNDSALHCWITICCMLGYDDVGLDIALKPSLAGIGSIEPHDLANLRATLYGVRRQDSTNFSFQAGNKAILIFFHI